MIAFVLSGGGNRGASQIGALLALVEHGVTPDIVVGTSAGALNGVSLAANPTVEHARQLCAIWRRVQRDNIFPGNPLTASWRILTNQGSLHNRRNFQRFMQSLMPGPDVTFNDLRVPSVVTATILGSSQLRLFGPRTNEKVMDALMASTAIPPFFAPYQYEGNWLVDGAVLVNLPLNIAVANGARTIYALEIADDTLPVNGRSISQTMAYSIRAMLTQQHAFERRVIQLEKRGITVHPIRLAAGQELAYNDFRNTGALIDDGYRVASTYLDALPAKQTTAYQRLGISLQAMLKRLHWQPPRTNASHA